MGTDCMPFNQARGSVTLRAAGSRPYDGWAIASAWYAETLPGAAQESRKLHQPGAPLAAGTARQITILRFAELTTDMQNSKNGGVNFVEDSGKERLAIRTNV